jgi:hypothetical protein
VAENNANALTRLDVFIGEWAMEVRFPGGQPASPGGGGDGPVALSRFEWILGRQFLLQRTEMAVAGPPDGMMIVSADLETGAYTQHYYDSRGVARLYAMSLAGGVWTLTRESPDFTPLDFRQRFSGTFSDDGNTISGTWEKSVNDADWEHDFALTYRRVG